MIGIFLRNSLICTIVNAQILNGGGKLFGFESSKFILAYLESPSKACCLNLDLKSFCKSSISLENALISDSICSAFNSRNDPSVHFFLSLLPFQNRGEQSSIGIYIGFHFPLSTVGVAKKKR